MGAFIAGAVWALWLGILTSVSPCPLATNIAAISFIGKRVGSTRGVLLSCVFYTMGRMVVYLVLGVVLVTGALSVPGVSNFLQQYINKLIGPVLILVGMVLLELIKVKISGSIAGAKIQRMAEKSGVLGAGLLGIVFALSFCPTSAGLFFGGLVGLALKQDSRILLPSLYGIGTGLPVAAFAALLAFGAKWVGAAFDRLRQVELWARRITGGIFVLVGIYYCFVYIFGVF